MIKKRPVKEVAIEIFNQVKKPLRYRELTKLLLDQCELTGKTPHESVRSLIGTDFRFKRVAEGVYALSEWQEYPIARFAKDIAYEVLKKNGKPMPILQLGEEILAERHFESGPKQLAKNSIRSDKRFILDVKTEIVSLSEWDE